MTQYGYYPGCSLERNASAYHDSIMSIAPLLDLELVEVDDWNCCGATEYIAIDLLPAYALIARNLALAADQSKNGSQLVAPCSACYLNLSKADNYLRRSPEMARKINTALAAGNLHYNPGTVRVRHLLEILVEDVGYEHIAAHVSQPLTGLKVAPYYGCLVVRPSFDTSFDDPEYPTSMDRLLGVLGADVVDFPAKAHCCGGHMTQISEPVALEMIRCLLKNASEQEADIIATLCPMCQLNLDAYQDAVNRHFGTHYELPVLYFTQLMGLAFGKSLEEVGIGREIIDARPALSKIGHVAEEESSPRARRSSRKQEGLPMPAWPEEG
jgi:heterodisulfide reductase subunit B